MAMTALWQSSAALLWIVTWWATPPASLADAARKEAIRREATPKAVASLSNLGQEQQEPPPAAVTMPPPDAPPVPPAGSAGDAKPGDGTKPAAEAKSGEAAPKEQPRTEAYWRGRITDARAVLERDMSFADALQVKINSLQRDAVNLDDPMAQTRARLELNKSITELDRVKDQIKAGQQQLSDIQAEARRLNIPAGWVR
jgi:hypothetical protein